MRHASIMLTAILMTTALLTAPAQAENQDPPAAPDFTLTGSDGQTVTLSDFDDDTLVVLEWICFQCPYVKRHHQDDVETMITLAGQYQDQGVVWLAIDSSHFATDQSLAADAQANGLPYPILNDSAGDVARAYGAKTTPDMRIIKGGQVLYQGAIDNDPQGNQPPEDRVNYVRTALDEILADQTVTTPQTKPYGCGVKLK